MAKTESPQEQEHDSDRRILARVVAGDVESFGVLVQRHEKRLIGLCERMLQNTDDAREAAQEVFLKAFRKAGTYRPKGQVYTWLYRIAANHCLNLLRRRRLARFLSFGDVGRPTGAGEEGAAFDPEDPGPDAEERLAAVRRWRRTKRLIGTLPVAQRSVLILAKFEGLSYREIAEVLEITEGAVESRLFRAMQRLRKAQETDE